MHELSAIIVYLDHFFYIFEQRTFFIRKPFCCKHLIRWLAGRNDPVILFLFFHIGTLKHLQKTKLQLIRAHCIYIIKALLKLCKCLKRQPCNKIQMLMNIMHLFDSRHTLCHFAYVHDTTYLCDRIRISRLNTDL